ncbi:Hypothetical predicted protein [Pelobates cultripes]|uniref:Uncharacterized protein n=1 Tax=Pelobates cultripes TaxID=61616 RepID=A0AAD1RW55_PELCU|nr:Hypothetical predicted protein [Pelobates cultripes]
MESLYNSSSKVSVSEEGDYGARAMSRLTHSPAKSQIMEEKLSDILGELRRNIAVDISMFRGVSAHLQNTEINTAAQETRLVTIEQQLLALQKTQRQHQDSGAALEDKRHWKNIKVHGLPDTVETAELPHLFRNV